MTVCKFTVCIYLRGDLDPRYCVEANCETHKAVWQGLSDDFEKAGNMMHSFPLVMGGLSYRLDAIRISKSCIIANIPHHKVKGLHGKA